MTGLGRISRMRIGRLAAAIRMVVVALILTAGCTAALAQEVSGSISGTVTDASGANAEGAVVTVATTDRGRTARTLSTNGSGFYTGASLPLETSAVKITPARRSSV